MIVCLGVSEWREYTNNHNNREFKRYIEVV